MAKKLSKSKMLAIAGIAIFVGLFLWGRAADAAEVRLGLGLGVNQQVGARYQEVMLISDDLRWYGAITRIGSANKMPRAYWRYTGGYRVNWRRDRNVSPYLRLGVAYFSKEPSYFISDKVSFDMSIGFRLWDIVELELQHNSTAGRSERNRGLDAIQLGVVLPFGK